MSEPQQPPENGAAVADDIAALQARLETTERDRAQFLDLLQRTRAEFENYQKRSQREIQQERRYAVSPLAHELLPALDNLERALGAAQKAGEKNALLQGVQMVHNQLLDALKRQGITPINALHQPFDPSLHQAVMQQPSADHPANTVLQVLQQGFMIHDRVLRPASVIVSAGQEG